MKFIDHICIDGFSDPVTIAELFRTSCAKVPMDTGIYLIECISGQKPGYFPSTGGKFKGKDPNYSEDVFLSNWVDGANIVYIGKAAGKKGLQQRLKQLIDFGYGKPKGHRGGRLLWHLEDSKDLLVRWITCEAYKAGHAETTAIKTFKETHEGRRPFANMTK